MATVTCPKCRAKVDTNLKACPQCGLSRLAEAKQYFPIKLAKIALIPFNVFLIIWLLSALGIFSGLSDGNTGMETTARANMVAPIFILAILVIGDVLLLGFLWFKKPSKTL